MKLKTFLALIVFLTFVFVGFNFLINLLSKESEIEVKALVDIQKQNIYSPFSGYVSDVYVKEGSKVKKGSMLLKIDQIQLKKILAKAFKDEMVASKLSEKSAMDYKKAYNLFEDGKLTKRMLNNYKKTADRFYQIYLQKKRLTQSIKNKISKNILYSTAEAIIIEKKIQKSAYIKKGQHIFTIGYPNKIILSISLPKKYLNKFAVGKEINLRFKEFDSALVNAQIDSLSFDKSGENFVVTVLITSPKEFLKIGTYTNVKIIL